MIQHPTLSEISPTVFINLNLYVNRTSQRQNFLVFFTQAWIAQSELQCTLALPSPRYVGPGPVPALSSLSRST